ncbi:MAG: di-trans,poly-cis-decaprenylcistransferase [Acidobacteria bacterium]|nr:di-trans,poly-cis-decaprenylcistransferase [Acidobacteriota bacterium]
MHTKLHVAIIMDGNGRWATLRGLPRLAGHRTGAKAVRQVIEAAPELGVGVLTLFAFSAANWKRPAEETDALMALFAAHLESEREECLINGVRIRVIGRRDRLPQNVRDSIVRTEQETAAGRELEVRLAVDYSAREAIAQAAANASIPRALGPDVDLLIRTGGEQRLSDFLLWECAWAEFVFTKTLWPDFGAADLAAAIADFRARDRRFGAIPQHPIGDTMQLTL